MRRHIPLGDYLLRVVACVLLLVSGYVLVSQSTFAGRLRDDVPQLVPGFHGVDGLALLLTAVLCAIPLLAGRRFLGAFLVSSFILTGIGAYWWTTVPWDEMVTESDFPAGRPPGPLDYLLVLAPVFIASFYAAVSRASVLRADYLARGADPHEAKRAAAASFLAGTTALVMATAMAGAFIWLFASGALTGIPSVRGAPAIVLAGLLVVLAYVFGSGSYVIGKRAATARPEDADKDGAADAKAAPLAAKKRTWW